MSYNSGKSMGRRDKVDKEVANYIIGHPLRRWPNRWLATR